MPAARRQTALPTSHNGLVPGGDILDGGISASSVAAHRLTVAVYGRNGIGKTTLACQGEGPIALLSVEPSPTGGARSVAGLPNVTVYQVAARYLPDKNGVLETVKGSEKMLAIAMSLKRRFVAGQQPFRKVVIDGISSWNEIILAEVLNLDYESMPAILGFATHGGSTKVSMDQYTERGERLIKYLRPFFDLPCDVWVIAGERDHNPPKETDAKGKMRIVQSKLMRDAHPMAQEGSFFSLSVGDAQARWVQDSCDFVMQLYEENEYREERTPDVVINGQSIPGHLQQVPTGRRVRRMRCVYHPNYAARFRAPDYRNVPEYIEAPTPEDRYKAFLDVVAGKRTKWGKYEVGV